MKRMTNAQKRIIELEDALSMFLECAGSPDPNELNAAMKHARRVLRNKVIKGWHRAPPIDTYQLRDDFRVEMGPTYVADD